MVKKFGKGGIIALSLHPQSENETYSERQRGSLKSSFEKIFRKIWKGCENELSLHHFPLKNQRSEQREKPQGQTRQKERNCSL